MYQKVLFMLAIIIITSCDDGDVFVSELDFPQTLEYCTGSNDLIIYTIKGAPYESLSVRLPITNETYLTSEGDFTTSLSSTNTFNYRTYSGDPSNIFCNSLPPTTPEITGNSEANSGTVKFTTTLMEDDNDGIPAYLEDDNNDGDNDPSTDPTDTDNDGVPNYLDSDDDGDNVPTTNENPDPNNDGDLSDAQDTDGDGIADYLDTDDDGDGVITRYEDINSDLNPANDISNPSIGPDFLNNLTTNSTTINEYRDHTKQQTFTCIIIIENMYLVNNSSGEILIDENYPFGTIDSSINNYTYSVIFN